MSGKTTITFCLLLAISWYSCDTKKEIRPSSADIYNSYKKLNRVSYFDLPPGLVSVFLDESKKGNAELKSLLGDINQLTFLIFSKDSNISKNCRYYDEISSRLDSINFNDLVQINSGKEIVRVKFEGDTQQYNELVFMVSNYKAMYCISLKGNIPPQKVALLIKPENISVVSNLNRFER